MQINPNRYELELIIKALDLAAGRAGSIEAAEFYKLRERLLNEMEEYYGLPKRATVNND